MFTLAKFTLADQIRTGTIIHLATFIGGLCACSSTGGVPLGPDLAGSTDVLLQPDAANAPELDMMQSDWPDMVCPDSALPDLKTSTDGSELDSNSTNSSDNSADLRADSSIGTTTEAPPGWISTLSLDWGADGQEDWRVNLIYSSPEMVESLRVTLPASSTWRDESELSCEIGCCAKLVLQPRPTDFPRSVTIQCADRGTRAFLAVVWETEKATHGIIYFNDASVESYTAGVAGSCNEDKIFGEYGLKQIDYFCWDPAMENPDITCYYNYSGHFLVEELAIYHYLGEISSRMTIEHGRIR